MAHMTHNSPLVEQIQANTTARLGPNQRPLPDDPTDRAMFLLGRAEGFADALLEELTLDDRQTLRSFVFGLCNISEE